ncbi:MAG: hypothetical protein ACRBN8_24220 [Nannocystales bacterium]
MSHLEFSFSALALLLACGPAVEQSSGEETSACTSERCLAGLVCRSKLCVDPDWEPTGATRPGSTSGPSGSDSAGEAGLPPPPDVTGTFHFSLTATPIAPTTPFQFIATTMFTTDAAGGGQLDITLQPLSLEIQATTTPREFVGDPILMTLAVDEVGALDADIGTVNLIGAANPVTGSDLVATMQLQGVIQDEDLYCGNVGGMVTVPANIDLTGSTFAAVRISPEDAMSPELLPDPPVGACP